MRSGMHDTMNTPLVTVCISTYNRMHLLPHAVSSVLKQKYQNFEIIIVDDCSSDNTEQVAKELAEKDYRIRYIRHKENKGLAAARNTAIFSAKGKYFSFVDDDDQWANNYIMEFVKVAEEYDKNWCFCCGSVSKDILGQTVYKKFPDLEGKLLDYVKLGFTPPITSQFYFTETLRACGGYNESVKSGVDHDLWLTLAFNGIYIKSLEKLLSYPSDSINISRSKMTNSYQNRIQGLQNTLKVWEKEIVKNLGQDYCNKFIRAYFIRENKKFLRLYLLKFDFVNAYKIYKKVEKQVSLKELLKNIIIAILVFLKIKIKREKYTVSKPALTMGSN